MTEDLNVGVKSFLKLAKMYVCVCVCVGCGRVGLSPRLHNMIHQPMVMTATSVKLILMKILMCCKDQGGGISNT